MFISRKLDLNWGTYYRDYERCSWKIAVDKRKVDTGAQGNVMPLRTFQRMYPSNIDTEGIPVRGSLEHRDTILAAYNGQLIRQYGTTRLKCVHETTTCEAELFVADTPDSHNAAFEATKSLICREVTLAYFNPQADSVIQVDASSRGLGAVLIQHGKPIAFTSKSLSDCEQRYANIEREAPHGNSFVLESDHKLLEMTNLKNLAATPQRLQKIFLRVQPYDFVLLYKPGKQMMMADVMSRHPSSESTQIDLDIQVEDPAVSEVLCLLKSINKDIDDIVRKCDTWQQLQKRQAHEPLMQHELPTRPWQIVGTDMFVIREDTYLLICDYYSKFTFVYCIEGKVTSDAIMSKMSEVFA
ncbi:hypothetical protein NP493_1143g01069 [Ridgeia piscesae]|uniref:Reverse transcriptase/retrotransposon-derived protein RNase H-like domain-containing protein n=1 Tax=Ridgeia piscesae TaxID=27915 RepID=A0AAD9NHZ5_RIDPI|nr:hypothetical protein NP493_1143g01069 [Ridgeia piscesae]